MADEINKKESKPEPIVNNDKKNQTTLDVVEKEQDAGNVKEEEKLLSSIRDDEKNEPDLGLNIEQSINSEYAENPNNILSVILGEAHKLKALNFNFDNQKTIEEKLEFHDFTCQHYKHKISSAALSYINAHKSALSDKFMDCKVAVINNRCESQTIAMAAIENISFDHEKNTASRFFSCTIDKRVSLSYIIDQFRKKVAGKTKKNNTSVPTILVVYAGQGSMSYSAELLNPLFNRGGIADAITTSLTDARLSIIYLCNDIGLYRKSIQDAHFFLLNISELHLYLYESVPDFDAYRRIIGLAETALSEYNWLTALSFSEQKIKIEPFIKNDSLEPELKNVIESVDISERKVVQELMKDPLQNLVLFVASFFEEINLPEFDALVRALVQGYIKTTSAQTTATKIAELAVAWDTMGDDTLCACGIELYRLPDLRSCYGFTSVSRKNTVIALFREKYSLTLLKRFETIEAIFLLGNEQLSGPFLEGIVGLIFMNALADREQYLAKICLTISDQLELADRPQFELRDLFGRLLFIIQRWQDHPLHYQHIRGFYLRISATPFRRGLMSALLTYVCKSSHPGNLEYLKLLLDSVGDDEYFTKLKTTRLIVINYLDELPQLFSIIESWAKNNGKKIPRSFSFAGHSILLSFYDTRFNWQKGNTLDHGLLKSLLSDTSGEQFQQLLRLTFSSNSLETFIEVFGNDIKSQLNNPVLIEKAQIKSMLVFFAFILTSWHYLFTTLKDENLMIDINPDEMSRSVLSHIKREQLNLSMLESAFGKVINRYNLYIIQGNQPGIVNKERKEFYKLKRDIARKLVRLIQEIK